MMKMKLINGIMLLLMMAGFITTPAPCYADTPVNIPIEFAGEVAIPLPDSVPEVVSETDTTTISTTGNRWMTDDGKEVWEYSAQISASSAPNIMWDKQSDMLYASNQDGLSVVVYGSASMVTVDSAFLRWTPAVVVDGVTYYPIGNPIVIDDTETTDLKGNVLQWDYGICKRYLRAIFGSIQETFVFGTKPTGDISINVGVDPSSTLNAGEAFAFDADSKSLIISSNNGIKTVTQNEMTYATFPITIDPVITIKSQSYDRYLDNYYSFPYGTTPNWSAMINGTMGTISLSYASSNMYSGWYWDDYSWYGNRTYVDKSYIYFDTTSLWGAVVSSACVSVYATAVDNSDPTYHPGIGKALLYRGVHDADTWALPPNHPRLPDSGGLNVSDWNESLYIGAMNTLSNVLNISAIPLGDGKGDVNNDGWIDDKDYWSVGWIWAGDVQTDAGILDRADCNNDSVVDTDDFVALESRMNGSTGLTTVANRSVSGYGDLTGDNLVTGEDIQMINDIISSSYLPTISEIWAADANNDGAVDSSDTTLINATYSHRNACVGISSVNISASAWSVIPLNSVGVDIIDITSGTHAWTGFALRTEREVSALGDWNGSDPIHYWSRNGDQRVTWYSGGAPATYRPQLYVVYNAFAPPVVQTDAASQISMTTAKLNGYLQSDGGYKCRLGLRYRATGTTNWSTTSGYFGDIDNDGWVDDLDASILSTYLGGGSLTPDQKARADLNHDTLVTLPDYNILLTVLAGTDNLDIYFVDNASTATSFSKSVTGLTVSTEYEYQAYAMEGLFLVNGATLKFKTLASMGDVVDLLTVPKQGGMYLSWTKAPGSETTVIRYKTGSYPTNYTDGLLACNTGETTYDLKGLSGGTVYYFRAWGYSSYGGGTWSVHYAESFAGTPATVTGGGTGGGGISNDDKIPLQNTSDWFNSPQAARLNKLPGYAFVNQMADALSMPYDTWWFLLSMGFCVVMGMFVFFRTQQMLLGFITVLALVIIFCMIGTLPVWITIIFSLSTLGFSWRELR